MNTPSRLLVLLLVLWPVACSRPVEPASNTIATAQATSIDALAERYVRLALGFGALDTNFVDAYTGPAEWREEALALAMPLAEQQLAAEALASALAMLVPTPDAALRLGQLQKNVRAMLTRMRMQGGARFSFNEEAELLYDVVPPAYEVQDFEAALAELESLLPGQGTLGERYEALRARLYVDPTRVPAVMAAAIAECRARTRAHFSLPEDERFDLEFVTGQPWSAYNWYQGDNHSLIQVNLDQPFVITRALDLGCHEGYPGHHVWNLYVDELFIDRNGWREYQLFPLFAPGSLFGEGAANYGVDLAFPGATRLAFEQTVLYPLAGLAPEDGLAFEAVSGVMKKLENARTHIGRRYLDGEVSREEALQMTMRYLLQTRARAEQSLDFTDTYRSYIINYTLGKELVRDYIEDRAGNDAERWVVFEELLRTPTSGSMLRRSPD